MDNNLIKCSKCGTDNKPENKFCSSCGNFLNDNRNTASQSYETEEDEQRAKELGWISLGLFYLGSLFIGTISAMLPETIRPLVTSFAGFCPTAGIVTMIFGRIKYPNNKFLKTVMWIILITITVTIILSIIAFIACMIMCQQIVSDPSCG